MGSTLGDDSRSRAARVAALTRHAFGDSVEATRPARAGFIAKFEREVDPEQRLLPDERARRAQRALRAHILRLSSKSALARKRGRS